MSTTITTHYTQSNILNKIKSGLNILGKNQPTIHDLAPVDEFHVGGLPATKSLLNHLNIASNDRILDIGCGIGGAARFMVHTHQCKVTGIDLTPEYIEVGNALNAMCNISTKEIQLQIGSGTDLKSCLGENGNQFDKAIMLHVGMNIENKAKLFEEIALQLRPGGLLGIYDIVRLGTNQHEDLDYPVPWASQHSMDYTVSDIEYREAAKAAGLNIIGEYNCYNKAIEFANKMQKAKAKAKAKAEANGDLRSINDAPPLSLGILMGDNFPIKMGNIIGNIRKERITPYEFIFQKVDNSKM